MLKTLLTIVITAAVALAAAFFLFGKGTKPVQGVGPSEVSFAAVPGEKGGQDYTGPYQVAADWPKPLYSGPNAKWTWGSPEGIFAESPDEVYVVMRGELPLLKRPKNTPIPQFGPSLSFPVNEVPFRNASQGPVAALPGEGGPGQAGTGLANGGWKGKVGVDARWRHTFFELNSKGEIINDFEQWDSILKRPHSVYVSPYDPNKDIWVVDDAGMCIYKFSHDGKELLQTIGTPGVPGADATHFNRPTFIAFAPNGDFFVADGYNGTRVAKFDKNGKFLMQWGKPGIRTSMRIKQVETRPGYFNAVHGITYDPVTHEVFVNDRSNRRIQVFNENGKFIRMWSLGPVAELYSVIVDTNHMLWGPDSITWKILKFDEQGHFLYHWGSMGDWPGAMWGAHQISVDNEGNLYMAEVSNGRVQKFEPRPGARPQLLIGQPFRPKNWRP